MKKTHLAWALSTIGLAGDLRAQQNIPCHGFDHLAPSKELALCLDKGEEIPPIRSFPRVSEETVLGIESARAGEDSEARGHLEKAIETAPHNPWVFANLGSVLVRLHQPSQAVTFLLRAVMLRPRDVANHVNMAWALILLQRPEMAESYARRAVMLDSASPAASSVLAWALMMQSRDGDKAARALTIK